MQGEETEPDWIFQRVDSAGPRPASNRLLGECFSLSGHEKRCLMTEPSGNAPGTIIMTDEIHIIMYQR
jgi:hypothetical protein